MAHFRAMGIISGASWHPRDVPFVCKFWAGCTVWVLWAPQKTPISATGAILFLDTVHILMSLA